jgi:hypothetical protein
VNITDVLRFIEAHLQAVTESEMKISKEEDEL